MSIVERAVTLTRLRVRLCGSDSWELFLGERTLRQLGKIVVVPHDPLIELSLEAVEPSGPYVEGLDATRFIHPDQDYSEWFCQNLVGPLVGENLVISRRVLAGITLDHFQFGQGF